MPINLLGLSGSLRNRSTNTEALLAAVAIAPSGVRVALYEGLGELPFFNPDLDEEGATPPASVANFRAAIGATDGLLICSPEYAHGVPGVLKNALDWLVSSPAIVYKPITLLNASSRAVHAIASLAETLRTMSAILVPEGSVVLPLDGRRLDADAIASDDVLAKIIRSALDALSVAGAEYRRRKPVE
jgi:NAD(P)H-dependent FMN reductase